MLSKTCFSKYHQPMTKKDIIDQVFKEVGRPRDIRRSDVELVINTFLADIEVSVSTGTPVKLARFGSFIKSKRKTRVGSDPNTHRRTTFKAKGWPKFIPSAQLKKAVA